MHRKSSGHAAVYVVGRETNAEKGAHYSTVIVLPAPFAIKSVLYADTIEFGT